MGKYNHIRAVLFDLGETLCTRAIRIEEQEKNVAQEVGVLMRKAGFPVQEDFYQRIKNKIWSEWKEDVKRSDVEFELQDFLGHLLGHMPIPSEKINPFI